MLEQQVGRGASGTVYRAIDGDSRAQVAIKLLRAGDPEVVARFEREANVLAQLRHHHIVRYLAHGFADDGAPYLAMEWLDGVTLAQMLADRGLSLRETVTMARAVAAGLAAAHGVGVVHRDIKPANLLLEGGEVDRLKIIDFGIARRIDEDIRLTITGHTVGTPGYMAPEQARGERPVDARIDLFALGCVVYECVAGVPAFVGEHATALLAKIVLAEPPLLSVGAADVPPALAMLVARLLAKSPAARPADAVAVGALLAELDELSASPRPPAKVVDVPTVVMAGRPGNRPSAPGSVVVVARGSHVDADDPDVARTVARFGARIDRTAVGWTIAMLYADEVDEAARRGVTLALELRQRIAGAPIAFAAGNHIDDLLERAARLLDGVDSGDAEHGVRVEQTVDAWLPDGVEVVRDGHRLILRARAR